MSKNLDTEKLLILQSRAAKLNAQNIKIKIANAKKLVI